MRDMRVLLCLLVVAGISAVFWGTSRYPGLDEKATMGGDIELEDPLGFEGRLDDESETLQPARM